MLEIIDDAFSIQVVHCRPQKVPVQTPREGKIFGSAWYIRYGNNLFEGDDLDERDNPDHIYMTREECKKEGSDHDKGPYRASNEGLFLLFIIRLWGSLILSPIVRGNTSCIRVQHTSSLLGSNLPFIGCCLGLPGSDIASLSEMLGLLPELPLCWNCTPLRCRTMAKDTTDGRKGEESRLRRKDERLRSLTAM